VKSEIIVCGLLVRNLFVGATKLERTIMSTTATTMQIATYESENMDLGVLARNTHVVVGCILVQRVAMMAGRIS
jgi:ribosomal protein L30E